MSDFSHSIFAGCSGSGKSTVAIAMAAGLLVKKQMVIVHTSADSGAWPRGCKIAQDENELEALLARKENWGAHVFIDEALDVFEDMKIKKHPNICRLHRKGRHKGYSAYYIVQDLFGVPPAIRRNVNTMYCFSLGADAYSAKAVERNFPNLRIRPTEALADTVLGLNDYKFLKLKNGEKATLCRL